MELASIQKLADELIERRCGRHSVGNVYQYLLKVYRDPSRARADFVRFLSGDLPIQVAIDWISEEQGNTPALDNGDAVLPGRAHRAELPAVAAPGIG